jgi:hypothetical protein
MATVLVLLTTKAWCFSIGNISEVLRHANKQNHPHLNLQWDNIAITQNERKRRRKFNNTILSSSSNNGNDSSTPISEDEAMSKKSVARTGGRKPRVVKKKSSDKETNIIATVLSQWAVPLIIGALLFRFLFGILFPSTNSNYVYYSRSIYQTTTYSRDGNVETKRKETFQSNIPGLVKKSRDGSISRQNVESTIEDEILDVEDEILDAFNIRGW